MKHFLCIIALCFLHQSAWSRGDNSFLRDVFRTRPNMHNQSTRSEGTFDDTTPINGTFTFQGGLIKPTSVSARNEQTGKTFTDVYGSDAVFLDFTYDYHLVRVLGPFAVRAGLGFLIDRGSGYRLGATAGTSTETKLEKFYFFAFPLSIGGSYTFNVSRNQFIYPFAAAMVSYIPFFEIRTDGEKFHRGGNIQNQLGLGVKFHVDWIAPKGAFLLDKNNGINNSYLQVEYRRIINMTGNIVDLSGNLFLVGFALDI